MAEIPQVKYSNNEAGRRVETRTFENMVDENQKERVVETHVEQIPMVMTERVTERIVPVVASRKHEVYRDGKLVDITVEELDKASATQMNTVAKETGLTKEDLIAALREVMTPRVVEPVKE